VPPSKKRHLKTKVPELNLNLAVSGNLLARRRKPRIDLLYSGRYR